MVKLSTECFGDGKETLIIAHGLFGSARNWRVIAKRLAGPRRVVVVDMRNHGSSPHTKSQTYADMAGDLGEVIEDQGGAADLLGHSMGGKAAMVLALSRPDLINRLIVADIAPVSYGHSQLPLIEAMQSLDLASVTSRAEADEALRAQIAEASVRAFLLQSLELRDGPPHWRLNLPGLARYMTDIIGFPEVSGRFDKAVLFLTGLASDYVLPEHRAAILALFPNATHRALPGAGHWLHAEKPREFEKEVRRFLEG